MRLFAFICVLYSGLIPIISVNAEQKPIIIFDLINVLFKENYNGFAQKIGYGALASYAITHWKNPGHRCLDTLHAISLQDTQKPYTTITINNRILPQCLIDLQEGTKNCDETRTTLQTAIQQLDNARFFSSSIEKNLMSTIIQLMLSPQLLSEITEPIKPVVTTAQTLQKNGYDLYLCANIPEEFYKELQKKYPTIIGLFKGIVTSCNTKKVKPEKEIFEQLLQQYNLKADQCIVIDTMQSALDVAQSLGMRGILFTKPAQLTSHLKKYGVY
jgi:HAD superfamily hydrolase (TIGR01509 family)